jgi:hypothetical protein
MRFIAPAPLQSRFCDGPVLGVIFEGQQIVGI